MSDALPRLFERWFAARGWRARPHQIAVAAEAAAGRSVLLIAPTGGGKTLAGFLPSLIDLAGRGPRRKGEHRGLHTLYISPLKALAVDIARNLEAPVAEMTLDVSVETRTGDTPQSKRARQKLAPPDILITTPEQIALLIADGNAARLFGTLKAVIVDELHALAPSKRGALLALGLARIGRLAPRAVRIGLSATVADPDGLAAWLVPRDRGQAHATLITGAAGAEPDIRILSSDERVPWAGHSARECAQAAQGRERLAEQAVGPSAPEAWTALEEVPVAAAPRAASMGERVRARRHRRTWWRPALPDAPVARLARAARRADHPPSGGSGGVG